MSSLLCRRVRGGAAGLHETCQQAPRPRAVPPNGGTLRGCGSHGGDGTTGRGISAWRLSRLRYGVRAMTQALLLGVVLTLALLPSNVPAGVIPLLAEEWRASGSELGWVVGAYQLGYAIAVLVVLPLTDRFPAARIMTAGAALAAVASLAFPILARDVATASVLRLFAGAGIAGIYMPGVRLIALAADPTRRGRWVGLYVAAFYLAGSLSLLATGILLPLIGWRGAAQVLAALAVLAVGISVLARNAAAGVPGGRARLELEVMREPRLLPAILAYSGHAVELYVARAWMPAFLAAILVAAGADTTRASAEGSALAAILIGTGVAGVFLGGQVSDVLGRRRTAAVFALASGTLSLVLPFTFAAPWILVLAVGALLGLLMSADSAVYSVLVTEVVSPARLGSAQAIQASLGFAAGTLGPVLSGAALDVGLSWLGVFAVGGLASLAAAWLMRPAR